MGALSEGKGSLHSACRLQMKMHMWGGDGFEDGEAVEKGKIRAWFGNIRRFKVDDRNVAHISEIENRMWKQTKAYGVAVAYL